MPHSGRRRSVDSSSSSSSSSSSDSDSKKHHKEKKFKHDKKKGHDNRSHLDHVPHIPDIPGMPHNPSMSPVGGSQQQFDHPPAYAPPGRSPSGDRIALTFPGPFPVAQAGAHPCIDADGSPVYIGSAIGSIDPRDPLCNTVHPCKIAPRLSPPCRVPYGGGEHGHMGRYDLLPFVPQTMEWVPASFGRIPQNRLAIEGGVEHGTKLYHAMGKVDDVWVPGKTGVHLVSPLHMFSGRIFGLEF
jgi:hypothetical protein